MQKAPQAIMSLAKHPINDPHGMIGKKIGVQAGNLLSFKAFLKLVKIPVSAVDIVPVQFDPSPLAAGTVDGWYAFITNEPFLLAAQGVATHTWLLYDYGYRLYSGTYCARTSSLSDPTERAQIVALMKGEIQGWEKAFADPALAAHLTVDVYGKTNGLDIPTQTKELFRLPEALRDLDNDRTRAHVDGPRRRRSQYQDIGVGQHKEQPEVLHHRDPGGGLQGCKDRLGTKTV